MCSPLGGMQILTTTQLSKPGLTFASFLVEAHEQTFIDSLFGETRESESLLALKAWLNSRT